MTALNGDPSPVADWLVRFLPSGCDPVVCCMWKSCLLSNRLLHVARSALCRSPFVVVVEPSPLTERASGVRGLSCLSQLAARGVHSSAFTVPYPTATSPG